MRSWGADANRINRLQAEVLQLGERDRGGIGAPDDAGVTKGTYDSRGEKTWWDRGERLVLGVD